MPREEQPQGEVAAAEAAFKVAFSVVVKIAVWTLAVVVGSLFGGLLLDRLLGTRPLFTLLLVLGGFPASLYIIYRIALGAVRQTRPAPVKEDRKRDTDPTAN